MFPRKTFFLVFLKSTRQFVLRGKKKKLYLAFLKVIMRFSFLSLGVEGIWLFKRKASQDGPLHDD
jgi:hypothetical protein|tara:strand:+ start:346 stop:540 length:195 start_codon:yes stop_codon:yes gene_type:complete